MKCKTIKLKAFQMLVVGLGCGALPAAAATRVQAEVEQWLTSQVPYVNCDSSHFVYGVGATDGSYMERIFLAADSGAVPEIGVRFRDPFPDLLAKGAEIPPLRFEIEMQVTRARYATPGGGNWIAGPDEWESALRFKYTNWFGTVRKRAGQWEVDWSGYRRPMLPDALLNEPRRACGLFEVAGDKLSGSNSEQ